ncbi:calcyclin-binding protein [Aplysia californica]|uniref:Calcyclin-binding protein n=1 Tax=Aplysia californica TaxID=6500 RepID=A0ABM0K3G1_APLCA|nr:calcyclin-binding protein [Aplysia californica]
MSSGNSLEELRLDLKEYESLRATATRKRVQTVLDREIDQLKREVLTMERVAAQNLAAKEASEAKSNKPEQTTVYQENITNYAWDQSDKFMKLYLTLDNLAAVSADGLQGSFTDKSLTVKVRFPNKVSQLHISRLCEEIVPKDCYCKKKSDYVLVMLKKAEAAKTWPWVTEREKKTKESAKPKFDESEDPSAGITKLLKNMYDDGDDEMKRNISKAFYESQMKQGSGEDGMPSLPGF